MFANFVYVLIGTAKGRDVRTKGRSPSFDRRSRLRRSRCPDAQHRTSRGFALVSVIWGLGLVTLLAMTLIVGARYRARTAAAGGTVVAAAAIAESAVNLAISSLLAGQPVPARCRMPDGSSVAIATEDETGKIDLNTATPQVLETFFVALTRSKPLGSQLAANVERFRKSGPSLPTTNASTGSNGSAPAKSPGFTTIMQLDQIDGLSPTLFRAATRHTTVSSGRPEPLADAATPALRALMGMKPGTSETRPPVSNGSFTLRADVSESHGSRYVREVLVTLGAGSGQPYAIREWRRGDVDPSARGPSGQLQDCFSVRPTDRTAS